MDNPTTADEILLLVETLAPEERSRLVRLIVQNRGADDALRYAAAPPANEEFSSDDDPLSWEAEGWEEFD